MDEFESIRNAKDDFKERRKKADWIVNMAAILSAISWGVAIMVWFVLEAASPEREMTFIASILRVHFDSPTQIRAYWDTALLPIAFSLLILALATCATGFVFNKMRMRRRTDKYRKSIFILGGITIIGLVVFILQFGLPF